MNVTLTADVGDEERVLLVPRHEGDYASVGTVAGLRERVRLPGGARAVRLQRERLAELQVRRRIREDVEEGAQKQQREYVLRRQLESIRKELGEDDTSVAEDYRSKIDELELPDAVREQAERELGRL